MRHCEVFRRARPTTIQQFDDRRLQKDSHNCGEKCFHLQGRGGKRVLPLEKNLPVLFRGRQEPTGVHPKVTFRGHLAPNRVAKRVIFPAEIGLRLLGLVLQLPGEVSQNAQHQRYIFAADSPAK